MTEFVKRTDEAWNQSPDAIGVSGSQMSTKMNELFDREDEHWRSHYATRPYVGKGADYEEWQPAYQYGFRQRAERVDEGWEAVEDDLEQGWESFKDATRLTWNEAKDAVRDAWHRVESRLPGDADGDGR